MRIKSRMAVDTALCYAQMNPRKRALIVTLDGRAAQEARDRLAVQNGGARPFNVGVKSLFPAGAP